jgi:hypothetical protein
MAMRTPKAASTTLEDLVTSLSSPHHFVVNKVALLSLTPPGPEDSAQKERVVSYCSYFSSLRKRTVSVAHIRYLDFQAHNFPTPLYVGTIRNPITRMQSHYNYDHFADRPWHISHEERGADTALRPPTFVECVRAHMKRKGDVHLSEPGLPPRAAPVLLWHGPCGTQRPAVWPRLVASSARGRDVTLLRLDS